MDSIYPSYSRVLSDLRARLKHINKAIAALESLDANRAEEILPCSTLTRYSSPSSPPS